MKKIFEFAEKIAEVYAIIYVIILHILAFWVIGFCNLDFNKPIADIVLGYLGIILIFICCDLCFLIPSIGIIVFGTFASCIMFISVPMFLFLALFQILGAQSVDVLDFGFIKTLLVCILVTPIGYMNLKSLKTLNIL